MWWADVRVGRSTSKQNPHRLVSDRVVCSILGSGENIVLERPVNSTHDSLVQECCIVLHAEEVEKLNLSRLKCRYGTVVSVCISTPYFHELNL